MKEKLDFFYKKYFAKRPARIILSMYIIAIVIGTILLTLPIASKTGNWSNPMDAFFTIVSAVCVTGLVTVTTATHWSLFGQIVIIFWIQLGGLGVMTAASIVAMVFNKKMTITNRINLSEEKSTVSISGIVKIIKFIIISTFLLEFIGAVFLSFTFIPNYGIVKGIWYSIFHAISAYCNAGFDIIGENSLMPYATNVNVSLVIALLIIISGLGHTVYRDLMNNKLDFKKYKLHTKLVLIMTSSLLIISTLFFLIVEYNNPKTLGEYGFFQKILLSFFESSTLRTAGFYSVPQEVFFNASAIMMIIMMFIGGSPAGTAGGFKTTSIASLFFITKSNVKKEKDINILNRRIPEEIKDKVIAIFTISIAWIIVAMLLITISDPNLSTLDIFYEIISAYGTVGLTRGITPIMSDIAKIIISLTMIFGKVGPISIIVAFTKQERPKTYRNKEENILIG